jgi:hypothetical protein
VAPDRARGDSLAECLEYLHRNYAERSGLPEPVDSYGDKFVARELSHAHAPGCNEEAPRHWGWCWHHDLEDALRLDADELGADRNDQEGGASAMAVPILEQTAYRRRIRPGK